MNIDQRLERLTERHEALVQYIELTAHENRENTAKTSAAIASTQTQINAVVAQLDRVVATISELATIAESHERRMTHLEDKSE